MTESSAGSNWSGQVPPSQTAVGGHAEQVAAVVEGELGDRVGELDVLHHAPGHGGPDADTLVRAAGGQVASVHAEGDGVHPTRAELNRGCVELGRLGAGEIPESQGRLLVSDGQGVAAGGERDAGGLGRSARREPTTAACQRVS